MNKEACGVPYDALLFQFASEALRRLSGLSFGGTGLVLKLF
jgi:hypothetical protein